MSLSPRPLHAVSTASAAFALTGLAIARLTLGLNDHFAGATFDVALLLFYFVVLYGLAGALLGGLAGAGLALVHRVFPRRAKTLGTALVGALGAAPLLYFFLLPDVGLGSRVLSDLLTAPAPRRALITTILGLLTLGLGFLGAWLARRAARRLGWSIARLFGAAWLLVAGALVVSAFLVPPPPAPATVTDTAEIPAAPNPPPPRVVLLVIDGLDLDDVLLPMIEDGELPHFARLLEEGTWGELETYEPTLSPLVWTTLATGKSPAEHGIRHFLHFRLPGISRPIYEFPLHTGLNFRLFPLLEKLPGMPVLRAPYTSTLRRAEALWTIAERFYEVGVYRWLLSWPAEKLHGFSVAGGIGWAQFELENHLAEHPSDRAVEPPDLFRDAPPRRLPVEDADLEPYIGPYEVGPDEPRLEALRVSLGDPTARDLAWLIERYDPRFVAAAFYSVDGYHHLFSVERARGEGPFAGAIAERYRFTDARLGELMAALEDQPTQLVVVSDHGFDFVHHHHTYAPEGVFLARGPAFAAGQRVMGLTVYDVAPLILHLLGLPLPDDMPGAMSGDYRRALDEDFLARQPVGRIATWERPRDEAHAESGENPQHEEIKKTLEALGYIK